MVNPGGRIEARVLSSAHGGDRDGDEPFSLLAHAAAIIRYPFVDEEKHRQSFPIVVVRLQQSVEILLKLVRFAIPLIAIAGLGTLAPAPAPAPAPARDDAL